VGADSTFSKGDRVDRFEIRELIAQGGMGAIYRAVDTKLGRTIALKVVRPGRLGSTSREQARQRFLRETLAMSKIDHRNVVRVLDFGFSGDTPYLAMEFLRGQDLGKLLKSTAGYLPIPEVVDLMLEVCAAIRACHDAGIIHRDLKPSNIFLCESEDERVVKLLDFGVSKPPIADDLTREGQIVGTPQYLAPEQIEGKALPQTDQYAVGVVLYACLTKMLPYQGLASFALLRAIGVGKFTPPAALRSDLPEKLEGIILRAMRVVPEERFESIHALGRELLQFASPEVKEQWRAYYVDDRLRAQPKASTHAMPLIEAMARGVAAERRAGGSVAMASTALDDQPFAQPPAAPTPNVSPLIVEVEPSRPPVERRAAEASRPPGQRRAKAPFVVAGVAVLAAAGWLIARRPHDASTPKVKVTPPPPAAPVTRVPMIVPAAPAQPRSPAPQPTPAAAAANDVRAVHAPPARREKRRRHNDRRPPAEQTADDVPIMP
jgi:serine/threonine-protein kinase